MYLLLICHKDIADDLNHYILLNNELCKVNASKVGANRAYFDLSQMSLFDSAQPAQGIRKRMAVGTGATVIDATLSLAKDVPSGYRTVGCRQTND